MVQQWVGSTTVLDPISAFDWDYAINSVPYTPTSGFSASALTGMDRGTYAIYSATLKMGNTTWTLAPGGSMTLGPYEGYSWPQATLEATFVDTNGVAEPVIVRVTHGP
jgi:hypothetical protein